MCELGRMILLKNVGALWMDHISAVEELQHGICLYTCTQRDPVVEYRMEGYGMFDTVTTQIRENIARMMLTVRLQTKKESKCEEVAKPIMAIGTGNDSEEKHPVVSGEKIDCNDPCPYGGGKKYKECRGREE